MGSGVLEEGSGTGREAGGVGREEEALVGSGRVALLAVRRAELAESTEGVTGVAAAVVIVLVEGSRAGREAGGVDSEEVGGEEARRLALVAEGGVVCTLEA